MSWSMSATGTKVAAKRRLGEQKIWGSVTPDEQAVFDATREQLLAMIDRAPEPLHDGAVVIVRVAAAGHGRELASVSFSCEQHDLK